jgi:NitT/TauT family transport system ATP-binding protein
LIAFRGVSKTFASYTAVAGLDFEVPRGAFVSLVGPSGCGKSTILNLAAGLQTASSGEVRVDGAPLTGVNERATYMFQQDALLPWKTLVENVELAPLLQGRPARAEALDWLRRVGLGGFESYYPEQVSGGMKKRAAMAQNWIAGRDILLMDEPFSALDIHTRQQMEDELLALWTESRRTVLFVTHDLEEAIALSDLVLVLSTGPSSTVVGRYEVDLPRPREVKDLRLDAKFNELYRAIWHDLRPQVTQGNRRGQ